MQHVCTRWRAPTELTARGDATHWPLPNVAEVPVRPTDALAYRIVTEKRVRYRDTTLRTRWRAYITIEWRTAAGIRLYGAGSKGAAAAGTVAQFWISAASCPRFRGARCTLSHTCVRTIVRRRCRANVMSVRVIWTPPTHKRRCRISKSRFVDVGCAFAFNQSHSNGLVQLRGSRRIFYTAMRVILNNNMYVLCRVADLYSMLPATTTTTIYNETFDVVHFIV
jgi:hypothetical protein